jgi:hypothetical protein
MAGQREEAGATNQSPEADTKIREVCRRRLPNGYVELILIGAIDASERVPVAPFFQSSQACAVPVASNSAAMPVRSNLVRIVQFFHLLRCQTVHFLGVTVPEASTAFFEEANGGLKLG